MTGTTTLVSFIPRGVQGLVLDALPALAGCAASEARVRALQCMLCGRNGTIGARFPCEQAPNCDQCCSPIPFADPGMKKAAPSDW